MSYNYSSGLGIFYPAPEQNSSIDNSIQNVYFSNTKVTVGSSNEYKEKFNVIGKSYTSEQSLVSSLVGPTASFSFYENSNTGMGLSGSALAFYNNGVSKMNITATNIGINTINPLYDLDIKGSLLVSSNIYVENASYNMVNTNSNGYIFLGGAKNGLNKTAQVYISGASSSGGGSLGLTSTDNSYINFSKLSSTGLYTEFGRFNSNGCLSINTTGTSTTSKILVNGDINASTFSGATIDYLSNLAIYSSNANSNYLPLTGGTINGPFNVENNSFAKFSLASFPTSNAVFIEPSAGGYYGKSGISFNGFISGNNVQNFVNPTKSKWSMYVNQNGSSDTMSFDYFTPSSIATGGNRFLSFSNVGSYASNGTPLVFTGVNNSSPQFPLDVNGIIKTSSGLVINSSTYTDVNLNNTSNTAYFASNLAVYSSNANSNYLPLTGGNISGNLSSLGGTLGTTLILNYGFFDINNANTFNIMNEPGGALSTGFCGFNGGFLNGFDNSSNLSLNKMQLIMRGVSLSSSSNLTIQNFNIRCFNSQLGWQTITSFKTRDFGKLKGYTTNISPSFSIPASYSNNEITLGIQRASGISDYRVGPIYANLIN